MLLGALLLASGVSAQELRLDSASGKYLLTYTDLDGDAHTAMIDPPNRVSPRARADVDGTSGLRLAYDYSLENEGLPATRQEIVSLRIPCPSGAVDLTVDAADARASVVSQGKSTLCWFSFLQPRIVPGEVVRGLRITTRWLPGMVDARILGDADMMMWLSLHGAVPDEVYALADEVRGVTGGWFTLPVVAPARDPAEMADPVRALAPISGDLDRTCELGWIASAGVCRSLATKLDQASRSLARGAGSTAAGQLRAFLQELEAQRGRHVDANAHALLDVNVRYVLDRLV